MAKKRGTSGICRIVALDKPYGKTSHDMVNCVRRIFDERRVGHTGTLDPLATGVLTICVGPAARLDAYLVDHDKTYSMGVTFGSATSTDDVEGEVILTESVPSELFDETYAAERVAALVGKGIQVPPAYSAIKVDGKKAYEAARKGQAVELKARPFEIFSAMLEGIEVVQDESGRDVPVWNVTMHVSKGTYMRSIARDLGKKLGCAAHVSRLRRLAVGELGIEDCVTPDELKENPNSSIVDPLRLLKIRWAFLRNHDKQLANGSFIKEADVALNEPIEGDMFDAVCCTSSVYPSSEAPQDGEVVGFVVGHELKALYVYDKSRHCYKPRCVFPQGVERGTGL